MGLASTNLTKLAFKTNAFGEITQNNGHYAVRGHSRSLILVPIETPYVTSYLNNTNLYLIPGRFQVISHYWSHFRF